MGEPLDNEALIKNSVLVTLVGTPSKLPAYHQMCATMSWLVFERHGLVVKRISDTLFAVAKI